MCQLKRIGGKKKKKKNSEAEKKLSVPHLDGAVPAAGDHLGGLVGQPLAADADRVVRLEPGEDPGGLPVPHRQLAFSVTRHNETGGRRGGSKNFILYYTGRNPRGKPRRTLGQCGLGQPRPPHLPSGEKSGTQE